MVRSGQEAHRRNRSNNSVHHRHLRTATTTTRTADAEQRPGARPHTSKEVAQPHPRLSPSRPISGPCGPATAALHRVVPTLWPRSYQPQSTAGSTATAAAPAPRPPPSRTAARRRISAADAPPECAPTPSAFDGRAPPPPPASAAGAAGGSAGGGVLYTPVLSKV
nr:uncharacterized protein LOC127328403 [Lolium perenne]